jgi:DNA excision repair protein ERCC-4
MKIFIDNRELSMDRYIKKIVESEVVQLPIGDLVIADESGALIVERKTVSDFVNSIKSNRLWDQLLRLMKTEEVLGYAVKRRLLVIQGSYWEYTNVTPINLQLFWSSVFGALLEIIFVYDTPFVVCENNYAFEVFLRILLDREEKGKHDSLPKARWFRKSISRLPIKNMKHYLLDAIPMIGEVQAKHLLDYYGSVSNIAKSTKKELMRVPGIGEKRAQNIYEIFH